MAAANTRDCFREAIGKTVKGVLFDAFPSYTSGTKTLVFQDGTGLTFGSNGSFWLVPEVEIAAAIDRKKAALSKTADELNGILELAGEPRVA